MGSALTSEAPAEKGRCRGIRFNPRFGISIGRNCYPTWLQEKVDVGTDLVTLGGASELTAYPFIEGFTRRSIA